MEAKAKKEVCEHYMGMRSYGNGTWAHVCIAQHCDYVDIRRTIKDLSWRQLIKLKTAPSPKQKEVKEKSGE